MSGDIMARTTTAILAEIERSPWRGRPAKTIFFGGGTPTFIPSEQLIAILDKVREVHPPLDACEITSEANPGTVDAERFAAMRQGGFNRISLGAQSFLDSDLLKLERVHKAGEIERAVAAAREAGFDNLNLDLMFALPGQSLFAWRSNLDRALALEPEHLSLYCLTIEQNTAFYKKQLRGELNLPDDDAQVAMYDECLHLTSDAGFEQYEISNFAQPGRECRHNLAYWHGEDYAGYGPGAVGCVGPNRISHDDRGDSQRDFAINTGQQDTPLNPPSRGKELPASGGERVRYTNLKHPERYSAAVEAGESLAFESERLGEAEMRTERIMLGLRLNEGLDPVGLELAPTALDELQNRGWLDERLGKLRLTDEGRHFCSEVALALI